MTEKNYFKRIMSSVSKAELVYWWILRLLMVFAFIDTLGGGKFLNLIGIHADYKGSNPPIQILANLVGMFAYEIIQLFPERNRFRFFSPRFQNITALGFFLGSFGGAYLQFYYLVPAYDKILHAFGTAEAVYIGYEYVCATQLKLKKTCPAQIATLCALGFGFVLASGWELFEFTYDQFFGGDAQHWNFKNALDTVGGDPTKIFQLFPIKDMQLFEQRFPLMDTMGDIVLNFIGAFILFAILCIFPYRHKGKNDVNKIIEQQLAEEKEKDKQTI